MKLSRSGQWNLPPVKERQKIAVMLNVGKKPDGTFSRDLIVLFLKVAVSLDEPLCILLNKIWSKIPSAELASWPMEPFYNIAWYSLSFDNKKEVIAMLVKRQLIKSGWSDHTCLP